MANTKKILPLFGTGKVLKHVITFNLQEAIGTMASNGHPASLTCKHPHSTQRTSGNAAGSPAMLTTALHRTGQRDTWTQEVLPLTSAGTRPGTRALQRAQGPGTTAPATHRHTQAAARRAVMWYGYVSVHSCAQQGCKAAGSEGSRALSAA